uniref:Uncharacterized protein n=1 Tax=Opuntia streptacantha TaxID=393608 RepID=A0A7C9DF02_OPUST
MACSSLNLLSSQQQQNSFTSPRISFSNGFADAQQHEPGIGLIGHHLQSGTDTAPAGDFEFSLANYTVNSAADELFFDGKLLPLRKVNNKGMIFSPAFNHMKLTTTLRDELLMDDYDIPEEDCDMRPPRAPKGSSGCKWKTRFNGFKIKSSLF